MTNNAEKNIKLTDAQADWLFHHLVNGTDGCSLGGKRYKNICNNIINKLAKRMEEKS